MERLLIPLPLTENAALFLDVDGTLIDIAPHPDAVMVPETLIRDLDVANGLLRGAVALVSGRTISNLDQLFHPLRLRSSGVHGAEFRFDCDQEEVIVGTPALPKALWLDLVSLVAACPGVMAENKAYSYAVHYRSAPWERANLVKSLEALIEAHDALRLRIMPGHFVFEIKRADFNKGVAVERFLERPEFHGRRPIFIGDDVTDWPGFAMALRHGGTAYSVGSAVADVTGTFPDPAAVRTWLRHVTPSETARV